MDTIREWDIFVHPFTCLIAGPTQSGKTMLLKSILENNQTMINPPPTRIVYCYVDWQSKFDEMKSVNPAIEFHRGLPDFDSIYATERNLLILDDLMSQCQNNDTILNLFTTDSHHKNISVFLVSQNLFTQGKCARTISLNCHYMIILNNPRDQSQINYLARQMYPRNQGFLTECYENATRVPYGHLFIDLKQATDPKYRIQTGISPDQQRFVYIPKFLT